MKEAHSLRFGDFKLKLKLTLSAIGGFLGSLAGGTAAGAGVTVGYLAGNSLSNTLDSTMKKKTEKLWISFIFYMLSVNCKNIVSLFSLIFKNLIFSREDSILML